jgi:glycosyltransferase involved in cell wall biosynthesis
VNGRTPTTAADYLREKTITTIDSTPVLEHCFGEPGKGGPATALVRLQSAGLDFPVIWQTGPAGGLSIPLLWRFIREIRQYRPQLIHIRGLGNEGFHATLAARLAGVPHVLVSIHGTQRDLVEGGWRAVVVSKVLEPLTMLMAHSLVTVSEAAARRSFLDPFRAKLLKPVPNGVPLPTAPPAGLAGEKAALGMGGGERVVVMVARLTREKGVGDLAAALRLLEAEGQRFHMVMVGPAGQDIAPLFAGLSGIKVHFTGTRPDPSPFYAMADIFVLPSWHEQLANVVLEAMSWRLPVITTNVGGLPEVLADGGGVLIPPHDASAIAGALASLLGDPERRAEMGAAGRRTIEARYSLETMTEGWHATYAMAIGQPLPAPAMTTDIA